MMPHWGRVWNLTLWVLQGFLAALFFLFGASKFSAHVVFWVQLFGRIGLGQWFRYFTGGLEVICAVLLSIPRTSAIAAATLACAMAGAVCIHMFILRDGLAWLFSGLPLVILVAIAWTRRQLPSDEGIST
jgi:putative oxidoreductase